MKRLLLVISILLLSYPARVWAETTDWVMDAQASSIGFLGRTTLHDFHGKVGTVSGKLTSSKGSPVATGEVEVPVLSLGTGNKAQDQNMYAMFEAKAFPKIDLNIESVDLSGTQEGDSQVVIRGVLTMHGVSRDASISAKVRLDHGRYVCEGSFPVSLKDYKLKAPRILFIKVADQVQVNFSAVFVSP